MVQNSSKLCLADPEDHVPLAWLLSEIAFSLQVSEERLIGLLEQIGQQTASKGQTKVTMQRRRTAWDDDQ